MLFFDINTSILNWSEKSFPTHLTKIQLPVLQFFGHRHFSFPQHLLDIGQDKEA